MASPLASGTIAMSATTARVVLKVACTLPSLASST
jgi:hypothetical protein